MKLIIQIPCFNEEDNISKVLDKLPKSIKAIDEIEVVVLDDNSTDKTVEIAKNYNVKIIKAKQHIGLSGIFNKGIEYAIENNADILVNIDGDNQYKPNETEKLIKPIINNVADIVIGTRPINKIKSFSPLKKFLQNLGSLIVKIISRIDIKDAASGFRAYNKDAIIKTIIYNDYTYTIESIIQAKSKNLTIKNVDIEVNEQNNRKSKLIKNNFSYVLKQGINLIRFFIIYSPVKFFGIISLVLFSIATIIGIRFLYFFFNNGGKGHIQSLILCAIIFILSFIIANIAILSDILSINRKVSENIQEKLRQNKKCL